MFSCTKAQLPKIENNELTELSIKELLMQNNWVLVSRITKSNTWDPFSSENDSITFTQDLEEVEDKISKGRVYGEIWTNREKGEVHTDYIVDGCSVFITSKEGVPIAIRFLSEDINNLEKVLRELGLSPPRAA